MAGFFVFHALGWNLLSVPIFLSTGHVLSISKHDLENEWKNAAPEKY